jgi:hypothetical protein
MMKMTLGLGVSAAGRRKVVVKLATRMQNADAWRNELAFMDYGIHIARWRKERQCGR